MDEIEDRSPAVASRRFPAAATLYRAFTNGSLAVFPHAISIAVPSVGVVAIITVASIVAVVPIVTIAPIVSAAAIAIVVVSVPQRHDDATAENRAQHQEAQNSLHGSSFHRSQAFDPCDDEWCP